MKKHYLLLTAFFLFIFVIIKDAKATLYNREGQVIGHINSQRSSVAWQPIFNRTQTIHKTVLTLIADSPALGSKYSTAVLIKTSENTSGNAYALTAGHSTNEYSVRNLSLHYAPNSNDNISVLEISKTILDGQDLTILKLGKTVEQMKQMGYQFAEIDNDLPHTGDEIVAIGFPIEYLAANSNTLYQSQCNVGNILIGKIFEHRCSTVGGFSGGPIYNSRNGKLVGIHVGGAGATTPGDHGIASTTQPVLACFSSDGQYNSSSNCLTNNYYANNCDAGLSTSCFFRGLNITTREAGNTDSDAFRNGIRFLSRACDLESAEACYYLAIRDTDQVQRLARLQQSHQLGEPRALTQIGLDAYALGSYQTAGTTLQQACQERDELACYELSQKFYTSNQRPYYDLLTQACSLDSFVACNELSTAYINQNRSDAGEDLLNRSCQTHDGRSCYLYASLLRARGNINSANSHMHIACEYGYTQACSN